MSPRIRSIKPEFPQSETLGRVSREARLCFVLLLTQADDAGRLRGNSQMLSSTLYPYDRDAGKLISAWLTELEKQRCIIRYEVEGKHYIQIRNWKLHQKIDHPTPTRFPSPLESSRGLANNSEVLASVSENFAPDQDKDLGRDQEGKGSGPVRSDDKLPPAETESPVFLTIPLINKTEHSVHESEIEKWQQLFPAIDVHQELRNCCAWNEANPKNRKTPNGIQHHIANWLTKAQNRSRANGKRADVLDTIRDSHRMPTFGSSDVPAGSAVGDRGGKGRGQA